MSALRVQEHAALENFRGGLIAYKVAPSAITLGAAQLFSRAIASLRAHWCRRG
jgi:hypothetical protein